MNRVLDWMHERAESCPKLGLKRFPFDRDKSPEEWRDARWKFIGASVIPTVIGLNPYKSRIKLWEEYVAEYREPVDNAYTMAGHWNEPLIQYLTEQQYPEYTIYPYNLSHIGAAGIDSATPDGIVKHESRSGLGLNEVKMTASKRYADDLEARRMPDVFYAQLQWQLGVTGLKWGVLTVMYRGNPNIIRIETEYSPVAHKAMLDSARLFFMEVKNKTKPGRKRRKKK